MFTMLSSPFERRAIRLVTGPRGREPPERDPQKNTRRQVENGRVTEITRVSASNKTPGGAPVLTDDQLRALGAELSRLSGIYPLDTAAPDQHEFLLDTEWKVRQDGQLLVKQVRPYLK